MRFDIEWLIQYFLQYAFEAIILSVRSPEVAAGSVGNEPIRTLIEKFKYTLFHWVYLKIF